MKPLAEHPEAKWSLSRAAVRRFNMMREQLQYRDAGSFGIQMFGEYSIWGTIKVIDNQILDFQEANDWKEQWAVCEALAILLGAEELSDMECEPGGENLAAIISLTIENTEGLANYGLDFEELDEAVLAYALKHNILLLDVLGSQQHIKRLSEKTRTFSLRENDANDSDP
ncbi:unnamed protein product [Penicillium manginii]